MDLQIEVLTITLRKNTLVFLCPSVCLCDVVARTSVCKSTSKSLFLPIYYIHKVSQNEHYQYEYAYAGNKETIFIVCECIENRFFEYGKKECSTS